MTLISIKFILELSSLHWWLVAARMCAAVISRSCLVVSCNLCPNALRCAERRKYVKATSLHPPYSPTIDKLRNKFLFTGTCCICKENCKVLRLSCSHIICPEDLQGYITAALGDISMFPLKCPMFHMGCIGFIETKTAKRVMTATQYERFCDFSDRALYGEGMRCLFCNNYVCYPANESINMVECPYCVQRFCVKCKRPWHYGSKGCPLDAVDDDLEKWKQHSGAQKCPTCGKLIEKDDPNTCNHMVHKITDGIPCVRERTDFCCKLFSIFLRASYICRFVWYGGRGRLPT